MERVFLNITASSKNGSLLRQDLNVSYSDQGSSSYSRLKNYNGVVPT